MRKPIIKNWIKYFTGTLAVSGLLMLGSCGSADEGDTDLVNEVEATESEPVVLERENVANEDLTEELGEEIDTDADDLQTEGGEYDAEYVADEASDEVPNNDSGEYSAVEGVPTDRMAYTIDDMDTHLEEHEDVNQVITQELTDDNNALEGEAEINGTDPEMENQTQTMGTDAEADLQVDPQGRENLSNRTSDAIVIGVYEINNLSDFKDEHRQEILDIVNTYNERRESMRGQLNNETGAYIAPEVDPKPTTGYTEMMDEIEDNITYPNNAAVAGIEGIVFVNLIIDESGNIVGAKAVEDVVVPAQTKYSTQPLNPTTFNEMEIKDAIEEMKMEAVEAVKKTSGQWEPAQHNGQEVRAEVQIPVRFRLPESGALGNDD